jgi:cytochrome c
MKATATLATALLLAACGGTNGSQNTANTASMTSGEQTKEKTPPATHPPAKAENKDPFAGLQGKALADSIMAQWQRAHPNRNWKEEVRRSHPNIPSAADNSKLIGTRKPGQQQTYGNYTAQDVATWKRETENLVLAGARVFHSASELGSTNAVSCDMCHPDAANTHPETYPKFQAQMGRVALLRDMINWCLINPLRAKAMKPDDPRMRALEAYIIAQRKGMPLNFGRH